MLDNLLPISGATDSSALTVIAGPCSAETETQVMATAQQLKQQGIKLFRTGVWKPRTKPGSFEGVGEAAFPWLRRVAEQLDMEVAIEVATSDHVRQALDNGIHILWIGARTTANPFAVQEIADTLTEMNRTDVAILVKNPLSPDIELWDGALQRFYNAGVYRLGAIHRGFTPYVADHYRNTPRWDVATELMLRYPLLPVICDPSHMGGQRELILPLSNTALNMGFAGLMVEVHCSPDNAWSDAAQQITPAMLGEILGQLPNRGRGTGVDMALSDMRFRIDAIDSQILDLLSQRMEISREIGRYKQTNKLNILQPLRFNDMLRQRIESGYKLGLDARFVERLMLGIHDESVRVQLTTDQSGK